ncbi:hypothetical protein ACTG9Q_13175 [Actinokineospora sp. 24-640]
MTNKYITFDGHTWGIAGANYQDTLHTVEEAMDQGSVVKLAVLAKDDSPVTVIFNGRVVASAVFHDGAGPRPTEIAG